MSYLLNPANYAPDDSGSIQNLLLQHLNIVGISMLISLVIALPLGLLAARYHYLYLPVIVIADFGYTLPAMVLLAFLVPLTGLTPTTMIIPLVLYTQLVLIRNIVAGINGIDPLLNEVASAMGMNRVQRLQRVTLPLALPVIIAGIRVATVTTIGIASLAPLAGTDSLGNLIFIGINNQNNEQVLAGAILISVIAIISDLILLAVQSALSRGNKSVSLA